VRMPDSNRIFVLDGAFVFAGRLGDAALHAHHALQASFALDRAFELRGARERRGRRFVAARVAPNAPHALAVGEERVILVYLDALHHRCRDLAPAGCASITGLPRPGRASLERIWEMRTVDAARAAAAELLGVPTLDPGVRRLDPRVRRTVQALRRACPDRVSVGALAEAVGLSASRLGHLFARDVGVTIPRYALWLRLKAASAGLAKGGPLTEIAHAAGFADSAHLSRTVRAMFGLRPTDLRRSEFVQANAAGES